MATRRNDHERSAAGLDFDSPFRERAASIGAAMAEGGPRALFDELENLLPEEWRDQIRAFPIAAMLLGLGVGVWLGMKKSEELIAAGTSMISAATLANVAKVMDRGRGGNA
ncbi:MAG TPA: hypothetical protein VF980_03805 [Thermoanaerobaculia bacterium]